MQHRPSVSRCPRFTTYAVLTVGTELHLAASSRIVNSDKETMRNLIVRCLVFRYSTLAPGLQSVAAIHHPIPILQKATRRCCLMRSLQLRATSQRGNLWLQGPLHEGFVRLVPAPCGPVLLCWSPGRSREMLLRSTRSDLKPKREACRCGARMRQRPVTGSDCKVVLPGDPCCCDIFEYAYVKALRLQDAATGAFRRVLPQALQHWVAAQA